MTSRILKFLVIGGLVLLIVLEPTERRKTLANFASSTLRAIESFAGKSADWIHIDHPPQRTQPASPIEPEPTRSIPVRVDR